MVFSVGLTTSVPFPQFPVEATFGNASPVDGKLISELKAFPAKRLSNQREISARLSELTPGPRSTEIRVLPRRTVQSEYALTKAALPKVAQFLSDEQLHLDQQLEKSLKGNLYDGVKARRKVRTVEEARSQNPEFHAWLTSTFELIADHYNPLERGRLSSQFESMPLSSQYDFVVRLWDGKQIVDITLR